MKCPCKKHEKENDGLLKTIFIIVGAVAVIAGIAAAIWANWEKLTALRDKYCKKNYIDVIEFPQPLSPEEADAAMSQPASQPEDAPAENPENTEE